MKRTQRWSQKKWSSLQKFNQQTHRFPLSSNSNVSCFYLASLLLKKISSPSLPTAAIMLHHLLHDFAPQRGWWTPRQWQWEDCETNAFLPNCGGSLLLQVGEHQTPKRNSSHKTMAKNTLQGQQKKQHLGQAQKLVKWRKFLLSKWKGTHLFYVPKSQAAQGQNLMPSSWAIEATKSADRSHKPSSWKRKKDTPNNWPKNWPE